MPLRNLRRTAFSWLWLLALGCSQHLGGWHGSHGGNLPPVENPLYVPVADSEFVWEQVVDTIDNHFRIQNEQRVQVIGEVPIEGRIDTFPTDGSTVFEPWRKDSTHGYEKLYATLQSIRRQAAIRVSPAGGGYLVEVVVFKELEDVEYPENSTVGSISTLRDAVQDAPRDDAPGGALTLGWIRIGRDLSLEQRLLTEIRQRTTLNSR
jgi:hypothetical protein